MAATPTSKVQLQGGKGNGSSGSVREAAHSASGAQNGIAPDGPGSGDARQAAEERLQHGFPVLESPPEVGALGAHDLTLRARRSRAGPRPTLPTPPFLT